jgi:hypothetical protein
MIVMLPPPVRLDGGPPVGRGLTGPARRDQIEIGRRAQPHTAIAAVHAPHSPQPVLGVNL